MAYGPDKVIRLYAKVFHAHDRYHEKCPLPRLSPSESLL